MMLQRMWFDLVGFFALYRAYEGTDKMRIFIGKKQTNFTDPAVHSMHVHEVWKHHMLHIR